MTVTSQSVVLPDWTPAHLEHHVVSTPGSVEPIEQEWTLPSDIDDYAFAKYVNGYFSQVRQILSLLYSLHLTLMIHVCISEDIDVISSECMIHSHITLQPCYLGTIISFCLVVGSVVLCASRGPGVATSTQA